MRPFLVAAAALAAAAPLAAQGRAVPDSAAVAAILTAVRGASPLLCELAARPVENNWGWGGPASDLRAPEDPVARAAMVAIRKDHVAESATPILAAGLQDDDGCVRRLAAPLLGRIGSPAALTALRQALRDDRPGTREAAAVGLGYTGNSGVIPALLAGLQDSTARVRSACAMALGSIGDKRATGALTGLLRRDPDGAVRAAAAWAIGSIEG
jgi:HEAT repeat protein